MSDADVDLDRPVVKHRSLIRTFHLAVDRCEPIVEWIIRICGWSAILFVFAIFFFVFREGSEMLGKLDLKEFFTSPNWRPDSEPSRNTKKKIVRRTESRSIRRFG